MVMRQWSKQLGIADANQLECIADDAIDTRTAPTKNGGSECRNDQREKRGTSCDGAGERLQCMSPA